MKRRKRIDFKNGDIFTVQLINKKYAIGQVLDQRMPNVVRIALFDEPIDTLQESEISKLCKIGDLISLVEVTSEQIGFGEWKIIGNKEINISTSKYPNEKFKNKNWIGAISHDAVAAEDFLNAFYALIPWDDYYDPNYLDEYLIDASKKPKKIILLKS